MWRLYWTEVLVQPADRLANRFAAGEISVSRVEDDVSFPIGRRPEAVEHRLLRGFWRKDVVVIAAHHQHRHGDPRDVVDRVGFRRQFAVCKSSRTEYGELEAILEGDQRKRGRGAEARAEVGDSLLVHVGPGAQRIDHAREILAPFAHSRPKRAQILIPL